MSLPPSPESNENIVIACLKDEILGLRARIKAVEEKCLNCPVFTLSKQNGETWKSVLIVTLGIVGAVIGFKVIP